MTEMTAFSVAAFLPVTLSEQASEALEVIAWSVVGAAVLLVGSIILHVLNTSGSTTREVVATLVGWTTLPVVAVASAVAVGMVAGS